MKLLICTQVVDKNHPILGFFHGWITEFSKNFEEVHVICLFEGAHSLPENVHVHSLGKEDGENRIKYIWRFYKYFWQLRQEYDVVFVHMNQVYVIMGGIFWRIWHKKIGLWYMHRSVAGGLWLAEKLTNKIFTASKESFRLPSNKVIITGHGVDTQNFVMNHNLVKDVDLISISRLSPSKNIEMAIESLRLIRKKISLTLTIIGGVNSDAEEQYKLKLERLIDEADLSDAVVFVGPVEHNKLPAWLGRAKVFMHTAMNGSLDKALLEPLLVGIPVVSSAEAAVALPLEEWHVGSAEEMAEAVIDIFQNDNSLKVKELQAFVLEKHSLKSLIPNISNELKTIP